MWGSKNHVFGFGEKHHRNKYERASSSAHGRNKKWEKVIGVNSLVHSERAEGGRQPIPPIDGVGPGQHRVQANINRQGIWLKNPQPREKVSKIWLLGDLVMRVAREPPAVMARSTLPTNSRREPRGASSADIVDGRPGAADGGCQRAERVGSVDFAIWIKTRWCCLWLFPSRLACEQREKGENLKPKNNNIFEGAGRIIFHIRSPDSVCCNENNLHISRCKKVKHIFIIHDIHKNHAGKTLLRK